MLEVGASCDNRDNLRGNLLAVATEPLADLVSRCRKALVAGHTVQAELLAHLFARRNPDAAAALRRAGQLEMARHEPRVAAVLFRASLTAFRAEDNGHRSKLPAELGADDFKYYELEAERLRSGRRVFDALTDEEESSAPATPKVLPEPPINGDSDGAIGVPELEFDDSSETNGLDVVSLEELVDLEAAGDDSELHSESGYIDDDREELNSAFDSGTARHIRALDSYDPSLFEDDLYELDEAPTREELQLPVGVDGVIPRHLRAIQVAAAVAADYELEPDGLRVLTEIFERHGWALSRRAVERELALGCTVEELRCAFEIRCVWAESPEFSISAVGHNHYLLTWPLALQIVRSFRGYPDLDEMVEFLEEALFEWKSHHATNLGQYQRLEYPSFRDFVRAKVSCSLISEFCNPIQALSSLAPDEDPDVPAGVISACDRHLSDLGVSYVRPESMGSRVGITVWHPEVDAAQTKTKRAPSHSRRRL